MKTKEYAKDYRHGELMATVAAREIKNGDVVFVGIGIPMIAGFLAIHTHAPKAKLVFEGGYVGGCPPSVCTDVGDSALGFRAPYITSLWRIFSDLQRGYFDLAMVGAAQVDKYGNVNSTSIFGKGTYEQPGIRLPGSGGANDMMSSARRTLIVARLEKRRFVSKVDFMTSLGYIDGFERRKKIGLKGKGPVAVVTDKAIFRFRNDTKEMYLSQVYPDVSVAEIKRAIGWKLKMAPNVGVVKPPTTDDVEFIRSYDPLDVVLREKYSLKTRDFALWVALQKDSWQKSGIHI